MQPVTKLTEKALQADGRNDPSSSQLAKCGSKPHDLLVGTARFVRRTVEKALYQQFVDADSDDLDKEPVVAGGCNVLIGGDSSSEGADAAEREKYQQQCRLDYHYQELEDEYGSKRSTRTSLEPNQWDAALGDSSDVSNGMDQDVSERYHHHHRDDLHDDGYEESSPKLSLRHPLSPPGQQVAPCIDQHDRIVGHEFGVKPLLDDDELSDIEGGGKPPSAVTNPFLGRDELQMSQCSSAMSTGSVTMSPLSSLSPVDVVTRDVFGAAPFHRKSHKKRGSKLLLGSPPVTARPDTHRSALTTGHDVGCVAKKDEYVGGSLMTHGLSPDVTAARSLSQSPQHTTNDDLLKHVASPVDADLFGFGNFATFSASQPPQPVACFRQQMAQQYSKAASPTNRPVTSVDFEADPFGVVPFTTDTFHTDPTQTRLMPGSATCSNAESRVHGSHYGGGHGIMPRRHRRHSSSDSHSSNSELSPHASKRDAQNITMCYSKSSDLLQDENDEVLPSGDFSYSSLKKSKPKARRASKPSAEFANLGFMDDSEREAELAAMKCGIVERLPVSSTMHQSLYLDPLNSHDIGSNYMTSADGGATPSGSNHTLPRARKHLAMPQRPTNNMPADFFQG